MKLTRVDNLKSLATKSDSLLATVENQSNKMFDVIEKLLEQEFNSLDKKNFNGKQFIDYVNRAENWKNIQNKVNVVTNNFLNNFFKQYGNQIDELKKVYGKDYQSIDIEQYYDKMKSILSQATNVNSLLASSKQQIEMLNFVNTSLIFNTQADFLITALSGQFKKSFGQMKTIIRTSQKATFNQIRQDYYKSLNIVDKKYIYLGPDDDVTRPFCSEYVNQIKTEAEWRKLDNGQIGSAWDMQGGYNCRHQLILIQEENQKVKGKR
jgi:hypothetical protein